MFLFITALSGLYGASYNSRHCLRFYSTMVIVMLLAQCALLVGYYADKSWKKKLPHDDTGEAARVRLQILCFVNETLGCFFARGLHYDHHQQNSFSTPSSCQCFNGLLAVAAVVPVDAGEAVK